MLARTPRTAIYLAKPQEKPKRLNRDRQKGIRDKIVAIMRTVEPTPFAAEGPCRAGIRASLCLQGWAWANADAVAAEIVAAALNIAGARRPTWYEGQPEWTQPGALPIERESCAFCRGRLPEGHWRFCCRDCSQHFHKKRETERLGAERLLRRYGQAAAVSHKCAQGAAR